MLIKRKSPVSGQINSMELQVTPEQIADWQNGAFAQNAFPTLSVDEREFIMTGTMPGEWETMFGSDEPEDTFHEHFYQNP